MIAPIIRTAFTSLRRDRGALSLSFILPVVFFSIFAVIFGGRRDTTPKITVLVVDEDHSPVSQRLVQGLEHEGSLVVKTRPDPVKQIEQPEYTATTVEAAVRQGTAPIAIIIPSGFGKNPIAFGPQEAGRPTIQLLEDSSDMVAPQMVTGLLQKVVMTSMPDFMAKEGFTVHRPICRGSYSRTTHAGRCQYRPPSPGTTKRCGYVSVWQRKRRRDLSALRSW